MVRVSERKDFQLVNKDLAHTYQRIEHIGKKKPLAVITGGFLIG
jgi:hypothetical protein